MANQAPQINPSIANIVVREANQIDLQNYIDVSDDGSSKNLKVKINSLPSEESGTLILANTQEKIKENDLISIENLPFVVFQANDKITENDLILKTSFKISAFDGTEYSKESIVNINVKSFNDQPIVESKYLELKEDDVFKFNAELFSFKDEENNDVKSLKISDLPKHGTLLLNENLVKINQTILASQLDQLSFKPEKDFNGNDHFTFQATDNLKKYGEKNTVNLTIKPTNDAPETKDATLSVYNSTNNYLSVDLFKFKDIDLEKEFNQFQALKIIELPKKASFMLNEQSITAGQIVDVQDVNKISYKISKYSKFQDKFDSFKFAVSDGNLESLPATLTLNLKNNAPISKSDSTVSIRLGLNDKTFTPIKVTDLFVDAESDTFTFNNIELANIDLATGSLRSVGRLPDWATLSKDKINLNFDFSKSLEADIKDYYFLAQAIDSNGLISKKTAFNIQLVSDTKLIPQSNLNLDLAINSTFEFYPQDLGLDKNAKGFLALTQIPKEAKLSAFPAQNLQKIKTSDASQLNAWDISKLEKIIVTLPKTSLIKKEAFKFKLFSTLDVKPLSEDLTVTLNYKNIDNNISKNLDISNVNSTDLTTLKNALIISIDDNKVQNIDGSNQSDGWDIQLSDQSTSIKGTIFNDTIMSGTASDTIDGSVGQDTIILNASKDIVILGNNLATADIINNFTTGQDQLALSKTNFTQLDIASNLNNYISIQPNGNNTEIYYDSDANGVNRPVKIATLEGISNLSMNDFITI